MTNAIVQEPEQIEKKETVVLHLEGKLNLF